MYLKRVYKTDEDGQLVLDGVRVLRAGPRQKFAAQLVTQAALDGWMRLSSDGKLLLLTDPPLTYRIVRRPGYYCSHDGVRLTDQEAARAYVASKYPGVESPDPQNPSGYERINHFECEKE
jgi:hypothetical protein